MTDIQKIVKQNATAKSFSLGKQLFERGAVMDFHYFLSNASFQASARVIGSGGNQYQTSIKVADNRLAESLCSCPYDWGGVCKHIVALGLELNNVVAAKKKGEINSQIKKASELVKRKTSEPYEFQATIENMNKLLSSNSFSRFNSDLWMFSFDFTYEKESVIISLECEHRYGSRNRYDDQCTVILSEGTQKGYVTITSSPVREVTQFSDMEVITLLIIDRFQFISIFQVLDADFREKKLIAHAANYGISDYDQIKEYFQIAFDHHGLQVIPRKDAPRLINLNNKTRTPKIDFHRIGIRQLEKGSDKANHNKKLLFLVFKDVTDSQFPVLSVMPFVSKIKKNGSLYNGAITDFYDKTFDDLDIEIDKYQNKLIAQCRDTQVDSIQHDFYADMYGEDKMEGMLSVMSSNMTSVRSIWHLLSTNQSQVCLGEMSDADEINFKANDLIIGQDVGFSPEIYFELEFRNGFYHLTPKVTIDHINHALDSSLIEWVHPFLYRFNNTLYLLNSVKESYYLFYFMEGGLGFASLAEHFSYFFNTVVKPVSKEFKINIGELPDGYSYKEIKPKKVKKAIFLKELGQFILIRPIVQYDDLDLNVLEGAAPLELAGNQLTSVVRNEGIENELRDFVLQCHPRFAEGTNQDFLSISLKEFIQDYWFLDLIDASREQDIDVYGFNDFKNFKYATQRAKVSLNTSSGTDWFDVDVSVTVGDSNVSLREVKKALISKEKYIKLGDGKLAILPKEWVEKLEKYLRIGKVEKNTVKISKFGFNVLEEVFDEEEQAAIRAEIREKKEKLKDFEKIEQVSVPEVNATLRDYQKQGFTWLRFLREYGWGGILADDMGLGKTLQVITLIKSMVDEGKTGNLIVVPTSLIFNWQNEIEKFCPSLNYEVFHGAGRNKETKNWDKLDLLITTYGVVMSDHDLFNTVMFNYIILDESQAIKNPLSKRFKAVSSLKSANRLVMTGTPVENNTFDLFAQITFVNPGFFISTEHFKKTYSTPIDRDGDQQVANELNRMINPFILRRTKELVAKELPAKTEDVIYCEMEAEQRKVYDAYRNKIRNELIGMVEENGIENSKLHILQALTKIRQICDSPALLSDEESYGSQSVKIKELLRHIQEKTGNHKMLVFSQFVGMLSLIRKELDKNDISYAYLDGQTTQKNREAEVNKFQDDDGIRVFLISLKAGGTGLNLTAADYVYLVDPWWNPAVENQAIDRCYRIGQDKKVIAYRMICKDTIEEKIMNYKAKKQSVADAIIKTDESIMKQLTQDDLMEFLG